MDSIEVNEEGRAGNRIVYTLRTMLEPGFALREARKTPLSDPEMVDEWHGNDPAGPRYSATLNALAFEAVRAGIYVGLVYNII